MLKGRNDKTDMLGWLEGPQPKTDNFRIIYENDEIAVCHQFMEFPGSDKEAVMMVYEIKDGKVFSMETGAAQFRKMN